MIVLGMYSTKIGRGGTYKEQYHFFDVAVGWTCYGGILLPA